MTALLMLVLVRCAASVSSELLLLLGAAADEEGTLTAPPASKVLRLGGDRWLYLREAMRKNPRVEMNASNVGESCVTKTYNRISNL